MKYLNEEIEKKQQNRLVNELFQLHPKYEASQKRFEELFYLKNLECSKNNTYDVENFLF
jgi:hypothetical protein